MYLFDEIFMKLVNMSLTVSWLIAAILLFRLIFRKTPKWVNCFMWLFVAIRLICPLSFESNLSMIPETEPISESSFYYSASPTVDSGIDIVDNALNPVISDVLSSEPATSVNTSQIFGFIMGVLWLTGLCLMLLYSLISYLSLKKRVRTAVPLRDNQYICDGVSSPFILGIIRPKIYLPSDMSEENMTLVVSHEKAHLKRKDHLWKPLGFVLLSVYWFNPLMWISYMLLCRDIELACDEKVMKEMKGENKKAYSEALFTCSTKQKYISACPVAFGEVGVKQRIKAVLSYKKPAFWVILISLIVSAVVAVCFMTDPKKNDDYLFRIDGYEVAAQNIKFYAFVSDGEYFYQAYDEERIAFVTETLSLLEIGDKTADYNEDYSKNSLVSVPEEGNSVFIYFDENYEKIWCCDVDGNYSGIYSFSGGEKIKDLFEKKSFISKSEEYWTSNPYLSATWHYQVYFEFDKEITDIKSSSGTTEITDENKAFIWMPFDGDTVPAERENVAFEVTDKETSEKYNFTLEVIGWEEKLAVTYYRVIEGDNTRVRNLSFARFRVHLRSDMETLLNEAVSKAIFDINADKGWYGECAAEGHVIFGTKESGNKVTVYMIEEFATYGFENGYFMHQSGHTIPAVMTFEETDDGYKFLDVEYARDGSLNNPSIKRMFPKVYESRALSITQQDSENMKKQCEAYAEKYLKGIGRKAEVCDYGDIEHVFLTDLGVSVDVSNALSGLKIAYNTGEVGFFEKLENGTRYIYRTFYLQEEKVIVYTKEVYGTKEIVEKIEIDALTGNVISTTSVPTQDSANYTYFDAKVLGISDKEKLILVEPFENCNERNCADKIWLSTDVTSSVPVPSFYEDVYVRIFYDGMIEETYPAKIPNVSAIYLYADVNYIGTTAAKNEPTTQSYYIEGATTAGDSAVSSSVPEDFDINFTFGIESDNIYDTYNNILKKDMVTEEDITVNFEPSDEELNRIYAKILELDITSIEKKMTSSVLTKTDKEIAVTPLNSFNISITMNGNDYHINGDATASYYKAENDEANRFCQFTEFMTELYQNTPEYKSLPAAVGAYS